MRLNLLFSIAISIFTLCVQQARSDTSRNSYRSHTQLQNISIRDGLTSNNINTIAEDSRGFIWIGTPNGLSRFDGKSLLTLQHDHSDSTSLRRNAIHTIFNDTIGKQLWIATDEQGYISRWDSATESFLHYKLSHEDAAPISLSTTPSQELLVCHSRGVDIFNVARERFEEYLPNRPKSVNKILKIEYQDDNTLWIAHQNGLIRYDISSNTFSKNYPVRQLKRIVMDGKHERLLYITRQNEAYSLDIKSMVSREIKVPTMELATYLHSCSSGEIIVGSKSGAYLLNEDLQLIEHLSHTSISSSELSDNTINCIYEDSQHNIWFGTLFGGVNYSAHGSNNFTIHSMRSSEQHLNGKAIRQITPWRGDDIFISAQNGGLNSMSLTTGEITHFEENSHNLINIPSKNVHAALVDRDGYLWISLFKEPLRLYRPVGEGYELIKGDYSANFTHQIIEDSNGSIWCAGPYGLKVIERSDNPNWRTRERVVYRSKLTDALCEDSKGAIWAGTRHDGLYKVVWDSSKDRYDVENIEGFKQLFITYIYCDIMGRIWVGTDSQGLLLLDSQGDVLKSYSSNEIDSASIKSIIEDDMGNIWLGTDRALWVLYEDGSKGVYTTADGLPTNQFNICLAYRSPDGRLFFGTCDGMVSFNAAELKRHDERFNVEITTLWIGDRRTTTECEACRSNKSGDTEVIEIKNDEAASVSIAFSGLNYKYGSTTHYSVKIGEKSAEWQYLANESDVKLNNLKTGRNKIRIKASGDGTNWDEKGMKRLIIKVLPPAWLSPIALATYGLILAVIIISIRTYLRRRQSRIKQQQIEEQRVKKLLAENQFAEEPIFTNIKDDEFIRDLNELIQANLSNEEFGVKEITEQLNISRTLLHTRLKSLTGSSTVQYVRGIKLSESKRLLRQGLNISEVSYAVGYSDPNYFSKCFKKEFNITPSEYLKQS